MFDFLTGNVSEVSVDEVKKVLNSKDCVILDVRTQQEYDVGHIPQSLHIPLETIGKKIELLPDKTQKIYVYCLSGSRSAVAVAHLSKLGYKNVFSMKNGLLAWRIKQYPLSI